ncbi:MAG: LytTR family transcriptional regulator [Flavobacteriales bacterium]|nr:LytTR family transcriptional regulator [Flavobacteriales bacterium]
MRIAIAIQNGFEFVSIDDIIYCQAKGKNTIVTKRDGRIITGVNCIGNFEEILCHFNFFRIHHSYIVNMNQICKIEKQQSRAFQIQMKNGDAIPLALRKKNDFIDKLTKI